MVEFCSETICICMFLLWELSNDEFISLTILELFKLSIIYLWLVVVCGFLGSPYFVHIVKFMCKIVHDTSYNFYYYFYLLLFLLFMSAGSVVIFPVSFLTLVIFIMSLHHIRRFVNFTEFFKEFALCYTDFLSYFSIFNFTDFCSSVFITFFFLFSLDLFYFPF